MRIDLRYALDEQKSFCKHLESEKGIKFQEKGFKVTQSQIIALCSELYEVANEAKVHKEYDKKINRVRLLEELSDCLSWIANIANNLEMDLVIDTELKQVTNVESMIISLNYDILRLNRINKAFARRKIEELIVPQFLNIVYAFGFDEADLKKAYLRKMKSNYSNPKFLKEV